MLLDISCKIHLPLKTP